MADQLGLFATPAAARPSRPSARIPSGADWLALGLTPRQGFARRYPRAMRLRGEVLRDVVEDGTATEGARRLWDAWYREHYGEPVE